MVTLGCGVIMGILIIIILLKLTMDQNPFGCLLFLVGLGIFFYVWFRAVLTWVG